MPLISVTLLGAEDLCGVRSDLTDRAVVMLAHSLPSAHASPESPPPPGAGMLASASPLAVPPCRRYPMPPINLAAGGACR